MHGFGFVECRELFDKYGRDVFIHKKEMGDFKVGEEVTFTCELNKDHMPQARDTRHLTGSRPGAPPSGDDMEECKFFSDGKCTKGSACPFRHGPPVTEAKAKAKSGRRAARQAKKKAAQAAAVGKEGEPVEAGPVGAPKEKVSVRLEKSLDELISDDKLQPADKSSSAATPQGSGDATPAAPASAEPAAEVAPDAVKLDKPLGDIIAEGKPDKAEKAEDL